VGRELCCAAATVFCPFCNRRRFASLQLGVLQVRPTLTNTYGRRNAVCEPWRQGIVAAVDLVGKAGDSS